jgi:signal transduction histidine kinase
VRDGSGVIIGGVLVVRDVADRRKLEREGEAQRALLQMILDAIPGGVYLVEGNDARLVLANTAAQAVWQAEWPKGKPFLDFLHANSIRKLSETGIRLPADALATLQVVRTRTPILQRVEILEYADGRRLPILLNAVPLDEAHLPAAMQPPAAVVVLQDVTALKEAEYLKDEFIAIATHELRTPATVLRGFGSMLLRRATKSLAAWQLEALHDMDAATQQLVHLTDDLLDVTRLQAGRMELHPIAFDLNELAQRMAQHMQSTTERHTFTVQVETAPCVVQADPQRTQQVVMNLLSNAIKYSPDGGSIQVHVVSAPDRIVLDVTDVGMGIPASQQSRIFGRFMRAENARRQGIPGTGLGLYLSRELIEQMGGHMWFTSVEGQGSTFSLAFPRFSVSDEVSASSHPEAS